MILRVRGRREHYGLERLGWRRKFTISQQEVEEVLEEGEGEVILVVVVLVGEAKKGQRIV